ncbi:MAG TPA: flagellar basal-body MS-ring/collar protein FliF [Burkholderiaceae bacterium]|nr:flagellar basal-body MS-ring/collar protein FliF [Burkholderiaceae bacterium]
MDTTAVAQAPMPAAPGSALAALPARSKLMLGAGIAALAAVIVTAVMWARQPDYRVLFTNLSDRDGGAVVAALAQMNVPYTFSDVGGVIMVPADKVHDARLKLASQGLPKGGTVGFELVETQKFGTTQFQERLNYQRGLEGELARSIMALAAVSSARVHLALPAQNGFFREQQKPSASVLLALHPGRVLERSQIAGIVHLVASSVPELAPKQVSIIDQSGALLSGQGEGVQASGLDPGQLQYLRAMEQSYIARIVEIVEPIVGRGNVKAQVTADVDFSLSESTAEQYRPNQGDQPAAVRSQQVNESANGAPGAPQGVPGALSNTPPVPASAPINGPGQTLPQAAGGAAGAGGRETRREATTNYEVDKTVRVTRNATGNLKRLTAAVVVNHRRVVDDEGKGTLQPLDAKEVEQIQSLVREAIGFSKDRGDALNVVNAPFSAPEEAPKPEPVPLWKDRDLIALAKGAGAQIGLVLLGLLAIFGVIRPALKKAAVPPPAARASAVVADAVSLPPPPPPIGTLPAPNDQVMRMARDNPATVANVVRQWVNPS